MPSAPRQRRPSIALLALEGPRAFGELGLMTSMLPLLGRAPRGDGHPVLVLPGFTADDRSTVPLRRFLAGLGYKVHGWGLGRNAGPTPHVIEGLRGLVEQVHHEHPGEAMSIVGWSLG